MSWMETTARLIMSIILCLCSGVFCVLGLACIIATFEFGMIVFVIFAALSIICANYYACLAYEETEGVILW